MRHRFPALSRHERRILGQVLERLIPSDDQGPGAREAKVGRYIASALSSEYGPHARTYRVGLRALEAYAKRTHGKAFTKLPAHDQDATLSIVEHGEADQSGALAAFFRLVLTHAMEGMFGDPVYGGNADKLGWALIGYPGPRKVWAADDQTIEETKSLRA
jgi:gluconate 2-dehydrogenase gamma chain